MLHLNSLVTRHACNSEMFISGRTISSPVCYCYIGITTRTNPYDFPRISCNMRIDLSFLCSIPRLTFFFMELASSCDFCTAKLLSGQYDNKKLLWLLQIGHEHTKSCCDLNGLDCSHNPNCGERSAVSGSSAKLIPAPPFMTYNRIHHYEFAMLMSPDSFRALVHMQ